MRALAILLLFSLTNCAVPVVTSMLPMSGAVVGVANGKITQGMTTTGVQIIVKKETGKTVYEHLFTKENKKIN